MTTIITALRGVTHCLPLPDPAHSCTSWRQRLCRARATASALEQKRVSIDAGCCRALLERARLAQQLDAQQVTTVAHGPASEEIELVDASEALETPREAQNPSRHAARLRQRHLDMSNNRLLTRRNSKFGHQLEESFAKMGGSLGGMRVATGVEVGSAVAAAAVVPHPPSPRSASKPEELLVAPRLQPLRGREPEGSDGDAGGFLDSQL